MIWPIFLFTIINILFELMYINKEHKNNLNISYLLFKQGIFYFKIVNSNKNSQIIPNNHKNMTYDKYVLG